jgi:CHAT domain-containing protein
LCAGARSVVSTLWAVDDLATALFSIFYYQHRQQGKIRPEALQQAQIKLRSLTREHLAQMYTQLNAALTEAESKLDQYQPGSADYVKWERKYEMYLLVMDGIYPLKNSQDEFPFSHPRFWAAFTCQGLR